MAGEESLLDMLWRRVGCNYLSDLSMPSCARALTAVLAETPALAYPPSEWQDVYAYVTGATANGKNANEIRAKLLVYLKHSQGKMKKPWIF